MRRDGLFTALGGVNSGQSPTLIGADQIAFGVNVTTRGGFLTNRPGFDQRGLIFENSEQQDWVLTHAVQGGKTFQLLNGRGLHVASIGGRIFIVDPLSKFHISEITPTASTSTTAGFTVPAIGASVNVTVTSGENIWEGYPVMISGHTYVVTTVSGNVISVTNVDDTAGNVIASPAVVTFLDPNDPNPPIAWMEQADRWFVIQNGLDGAILYDGSTVRRAKPGVEVPTGTAMVFNEEIQRLCVATIDNLIEIGDIATGPTSVISFTEKNYLAEGGAFRIPFRFGRINAMVMIANIDRSNGQGAMLVFAQRGITSFNLPPNRNLWKDLQGPVQINMPIRQSSLSQAATVDVNGDVFYIGKQGLHSFAYAIRQFSVWGNKPQSRELNRVIRQGTERLLRYSSSILFDNRLIFTLLPLPSAIGTYHQCMGVLDFDITSSIRGDAPAAYDGIWTGFQPTLLWTGEFADEERAFAWARNAAGHNELWEISKNADFDNGSVRIVSSFETRSLAFSDMTELTEMLACELWIAEVKGTVNFDLKFKPDQFPCWIDYGTREVCNKRIDCTVDPLVCKTMKTFKPGYRTRIGFGTPVDANESIDGKAARVSYEQQMRLEWTGKTEIRKMLLKNIEADESEWARND